jgi:hypothetical protein
VRRFATRYALVACGCVVFGWACTLFNPLDDYGPPRSRPVDASRSDGAASADGAAACVSARWPERPTADGPSVAELVVATETIDIGWPKAPGAPVPGFDLDGVCSCPGPPSCVTPPTGKVACDADGGIDTAGTEVISGLLQLSEVTLDITARIRTGEHGLVMRLREYNGGPDDSRVELAVFLSGGSEGAQEGAPVPPRFDGNDVWTVDPSSLFDKNVPPYRALFADTNAYVAGGTLVASVDFPLRLSEFTMRLRGSILTAKLVADGASFRLVDGHVAGRWSTKELLTGLDTTGDPFDGDAGGGLCGDSGTYQLLKAKVCAAADLASDPQRDNTSAPCDALATTVLFTAGRAKLGAPFAPAPKRRKCGDTWTDDCPK